MNIYLITINEYAGYDSYDGHVVIARNAVNARKLCQYGTEGDIWKDTDMTTLRKIGETNHIKEYVVLSSFNAG